jgi:hypothetical protein
MRDLDIATRALASAIFAEDGPFDALGPDATNLLSRHWRDLDRDSPAKVWNALPFNHPAIARALKIDKSDPTATFALLPFRYHRADTGHRILAAWPTPRTLGPSDDDWLGIDVVLSWCPVTNAVEVLGDSVPQLVGAFRDDATALFSDPLAFFHAWMRRRAAFLVQWQQAARTAWQSKPLEPDLAPGCLMVGAADAIRWRAHDLPATLECVGVDPARVNRAILKAAQLPRAVNAMRAAA